MGLGGHWRGHRGTGRRTEPADPGDRPQGRQGRHRPAHAADNVGDRPGNRRGLRRTYLPRARLFLASGGSSAGQPAAPGRQARRPTQPAARVHHRGAGRRHAAPRYAEAASHGYPRTTMRYDRARASLDCAPFRSTAPAETRSGRVMVLRACWSVPAGIRSRSSVRPARDGGLVRRRTVRAIMTAATRSAALRVRPSAYPSLRALGVAVGRRGCARRWRGRRVRARRRSGVSC